MYRHPFIAREGWFLIGLVLIATLVVQYSYGSSAAILLWMLQAILLFLFRDPARKIPASPLGILSPADAAVVSIDSIHDDYLDRDVTRIALKMDILGVHSLRSPTEGKIVQHWFKREDHHQYLHYALLIQTDEQDDVLLEIIIPKIISPVCDIQSGERVGQGARCGFVYLRAKVNILLPTSARINVSVGDRVKAGMDIIASLTHK